MIQVLFSLISLWALNAHSNDFIVEMAPQCPGIINKAHKVFGKNKQYALISPKKISEEKLKSINCVMSFERDKKIEGQSATLHQVFDELPKDPKFKNQWALNNPRVPGSDISVLEVWEKFTTGGPQVKVAVMDTGIDWDHQDLKKNLYTNPGEAGVLAYNGVDDDGNGYIDDVHGWNSLNGTPDSRDDHGHGTHVAGIIGAVGDNNIGVAGVAWSVSLVPIKMLGKTNSGHVSKTIEALDYALANDFDIINASWSGLPYSKIILGQMHRLADKGVLFVAASGNEIGNTHTPVHFFPEFYQTPTVISAAATNKEGLISSMSNWGEDVADIAAPGERVLSTYFGDKYSEMTGTSMAAPQISGAAALLKARSPWLSGLDLKNRILLSSLPREDLCMKVNTQGALNILNAFNQFYPKRKLPRFGPWETKTYNYETEHPVQKRKDLNIKVPGASFLRLRFSQIDFKKRDKIVIRSKKAPGIPYGQGYQNIKGQKENFTSVYVPGDEIIVQYVDLSEDIESWGFAIESIEVIWEKAWEALPPEDYSQEILTRPMPHKAK